MSDPDIDEQDRPLPPTAGDEAATLVGFLDFQRATLAWKTRGLGAEGLRGRLGAHPTGMTLAGLVKHLAWVEDYWFTETAGRSPMPAPWAGVDWDADPAWEWTSALTDTPEELLATWEAAVARSRDVTAALLAEGGPGVGGTHPAWGGREQVSLRWILTHMIEEYARHNGHADLLRELVDGETGE